MSQLDEIQNKYNTEVTRRPVGYRASILGYDGDPNDATAPNDLKNAPAGTFYVRDTTLLERHIKKSSAPASWENFGAGTRTVESITVTIDPAETEIPPPAAVFESQAAVDEWLSDNGVSAFKYIQDFISVLPEEIAYSIILNLVSGTIEPRTGEPLYFIGAGTKMVLRDTVGGLNGGSISLVGEYDDNNMDSWTVVDGPETIIGYQLDDEVTGYTEPYWDFAASTFPTDDSLIGRFALDSDGNWGVIYDHTDSRIYVNRVLSTTPTNGVTTVSVIQPPVVLDSNYTADASIVHRPTVIGDPDTAFVIGNLELSYLTLTMTGELNAGVVSVNGPHARVEYCVMRPYGGGSAFPFGGGLRLECSHSVRLDYVGIWQEALNGSPNAWLFGDSVLLQGCVFHGNTNLSSVRVRGTLQLWAGNVWVNFEPGGGAAIFDFGYAGLSVNGSIRSISSIGGSMPNLFLRGLSAKPAIEVYGGEVLNVGSDSRFDLGYIEFDTCLGPCIRIGPGVQAYFGPGPNASVGASPTDRSGCNDVGFDIRGTNVRLLLPAATNITGTVGDIRLPDGTIASYADVDGGSQWPSDVFIERIV